jgi:hypothetical protein
MIRFKSQSDYFHRFDGYGPVASFRVDGLGGAKSVRTEEMDQPGVIPVDQSWKRGGVQRIIDPGRLRNGKIKLSYTALRDASRLKNYMSWTVDST